MSTSEKSRITTQNHESIDIREFVNPHAADGDAILGSRAVVTSMVEAQRNLQDLPPLDNFEDRQQTVLNNAYYDVIQLSRWSKRRFNKDVRKKKPSEWLTQSLSVEGVSRHNYAEMIAESDNDAAILNFLQWHNHGHAKDQAELDKEVKQYKELYKDKMTAAIGKGWVPEWVADRIDERLLETFIILDDKFTTSYKDKGLTRTSAHARNLSGKDFITFAPHTPRSKNVDSIVIHEFHHVMDGRDEKEQKDFGNHGMYRLFDPEANSVAGVSLNEAVVEHLASAMYYDDDVDVIDTSAKGRDHMVYVAERNLLNTLATMGSHSIDIRDFIAAHFDEGEHTDEDGLTPIEKLKAKLITAFPTRDVIRELEECKNQRDIKWYTRKLRIEYNGLRVSAHEIKRNIKIGTMVGLASVALSGTTIGIADLMSDEPVKLLDTEPAQSIYFDQSSNGVVLNDKGYEGNVVLDSPQIISDTKKQNNSENTRHVVR